jgi:Co-chaperone HscB tetracysteine metal binding motif
VLFFVFVTLPAPFFNSMRRLAQTLVRRTHAHWALADAAPAAATAWRPPPRALATAAPAAPPCWSCGDGAGATAAPSLFCGSCRAVQPPPARGGVDLFQLLGV